MKLRQDEENLAVLGGRGKDKPPSYVNGTHSSTDGWGNNGYHSNGFEDAEGFDVVDKKHKERKGLFQMALEGMKSNLIPGLILQVVALFIVLGYFYIDSIRSVFDSIAEVKTEYGYWFSGISTSLFGGLIPWIVITLKSVITERRKGADGKDLNLGLILGQGLFYILFYAEKGVEVDAFYRLQAYIWGDDNDVWTIVKKVIVDQFVYNPLWAAPSTMLPFMWKDLDFSFSRLREELDWTFITYRVPCCLVSTWIVWVPAVSLVYTLPSALQIPLFNLVLCFFVLLITFLSQNAGGDSGEEQKRKEEEEEEGNRY